MKPKNVNLDRILLVYLSLRGTLGDAVHRSYDRSNQHRSQLNIKQTSGGHHQEEGRERDLWVNQFNIY